MKKKVDIVTTIRRKNVAAFWDRICVRGPEASPTVPYFICRIDSNSVISRPIYLHYQNKAEALEHSIRTIKSAYRGKRIADACGRPIDLYKMVGLDAPLLGLPRAGYRLSRKEKQALTKPVEIRGFINGKKGPAGVHVRLDVPERIDHRTWKCVIGSNIPVLPKNGIAIMGVSAIQARELAMKLLFEILEPLSIADANGKPIDLLTEAGFGKRIVGVEKGPFQNHELPPLGFEESFEFLDNNERKKAMGRVFGPVQVIEGEDDFACVIEAPPIMVNREWIFGRSPAEVQELARNKIRFNAISGFRSP